MKHEKFGPEESVEEEMDGAKSPDRREAFHLADKLDAIVENSSVELLAEALAAMGPNGRVMLEKALEKAKPGVKARERAVGA